MTARNYMDLVILVENQLGWSPDPALPLWKARRIEAGKLKSLVAKQPREFSIPKLEAAVHLLHSKRKGVTSPVNISYYVEDAVKVAADPSYVPTSDRIDAAMAREREGGHSGNDEWIGRLARVSPQHQERVLTEWETERGHLWAK